MVSRDGPFPHPAHQHGREVNSISLVSSTWSVIVPGFEVQNTADFDLVWPLHRKGRPATHPSSSAPTPTNSSIRHPPCCSISPSICTFIILGDTSLILVHQQSLKTSQHTQRAYSWNIKEKGYINSSIKDKSRRWGSDLMSYLIQITVHDGVNYTETCFVLKTVGKGQDSIHCIIQHFYLNVFLFQRAKPRGSIIAGKGTMKPKVQNCDEAASVAAYWDACLGPFDSTFHSPGRKCFMGISRRVKISICFLPWRSSVLVLRSC